MEQIVVKKPDGSTLPLFGSAPVRQVTKAEQSRELLGEDTLSLTVETTMPINFSIGDTVLAYGEEYTLNQMPTARKVSEHHFVYDLTFEGSQYSLLRVLYFNADISGFATGTEFPLTGDLVLFMNVLMTNINRALTGWTLGVVPTGTAVKDLSFSNENCLAVLQKLCQEYATEFEIVRAANGTRTLSIRKLGTILGQTFEYGRAGGLYELQRQTISDKAFITRLYAFGGTKNLKSNYRNYSPRLRMATDGSYLEKAEAKAAFGLIEGTKAFDDIFPRRTGTVSGVQAGNLLQFVDTSMDFDLTEIVPGSTQTVNGKTVSETKYLIAGVAAKVHFNSGKLAGYEFQITKYVHATKTFTLLAFQDERGQNFPAAGAFEITAGDKYVLIDIVMPDSYITAAETELQTAAQTYLDQNAAPRVQYQLSVDELYLKGRSANGALTNFFSLGDVLTLKDDDLAINKGSRVVGFKRDLIRPYKYSLDLADSYEVSLVERILAAQAEIDTVVRINDLRDASAAKSGWRNTQETLSMIFDPDGYFDGGKIRPESIETSMLVVGAKSQQFVLNCVIEPNFQGNANAVRCNAGTLTHYTIEATIRTWQINVQGFVLTDNNARYIYARCNKSDYNDGYLLFSTQQIKPNDSATYYHFLIGVLNSVDNAAGAPGVRWISLTYGATAINGRFVKTGKIQSFDGLTYFDLDLGEIGGNITFVSTTGAKKPIIDITKTNIDGGIVTSGTIELAGESAPGVPGSILAGITGEGTADTSVRIWAGASKANRAYAPYRVLQSGELFARKRIELMNENNVGEAGISGSNTTADGNIRFWAGSPYAGRANAPFRVDSTGAMTATAGRFGGWQITGNGILNEDGSAYIIARSSTSNFRTEARIGAQVFPATFGGKGAAMFVATESDAYSPNYAAVFQAAGGTDLTGKPGNFAIYAQQGTALLGEALLNGRRYLGQSINNVSLLVDPSMYDVIEIYPEGPVAGLKFITPASPLKNGKMVIVINCNDPYGPFYLYNIVRGAASFKLEGGNVATLMYSNGFWVCCSVWNNDWGASTPPFIVEPVNNAPTVINPMPDRTMYGSSPKGFVVPANTFSDPGDTLSYSARQQNGSALPAGISFDPSTRAYVVTQSLVPDHSVFYLATVATDTVGHTAIDGFTLTIDWLGTAPTASNPAPVVANPYPDAIIRGTQLQTLVIPLSTFSDPGDTLIYSAKQQDGTDLPAGVTFDVATRTYSFDASIADGSILPLKTIATDTAGQSVSDAFLVTIDRAGGGRTGVSDLDELLGPPIVYTGQLVPGWNSHPDRGFGVEIVPGSFDGWGAKVRRINSYTAPPGKIVKFKVKERYKDPAELETIWIECGKPCLIKEYHTSGTDESGWDMQENFFDNTFEINFIIN